MSDPLPAFLSSDRFFFAVIIGLVCWWFIWARKSERRVKTFVWVVLLLLGLAMVHNALWGVSGRWGPWNEDFCTEPRERPGS